MYKLNLAHVYPNLLNLYGDNGNVTVLKKRCEWRNIELYITEINEGDNINPEFFDIYFIGSGLELQQNFASKEIIKQKTALQFAAIQNNVILGIDSGYQILGEYYENSQKEQIEGLNILNTYTKNDGTRFIGNVSAKCDFLSPQTLVGFENHAGKTYIKEGTTPLSKLEIGKGNNGEDCFEGARKNNVFGTYLHGAFLPKNVHFADYLIKLALEKKYNEKISLIELDDEIEKKTHNSLIGKKY